MTSTTDLDARATLAAARRARAEADAAEVVVFTQALEWARLNVVTEPDESATWGDTPVPLAGPGAPMVSEFCVTEFATALGMSRDSGRYLLSHALEIAYRLPKVWFRVQTGELQVWRARRIAEKTLHLTPEAAAFVDEHVAGFAHRIGPAQTDRVVDEAIARHMPDTAEKIARQAADGRHVSIDHRQESFAGTSTIYGELDLADALDLDQALIRGAETLKAAGSEDGLDARRAAALGALARGQDGLGLQAARTVDLFVHLGPDADETGIATVENRGPHLFTRRRAEPWGGSAGPDPHRPVVALTGQSGGVGGKGRRTARLKAWRGAARPKPGTAQKSRRHGTTPGGGGSGRRPRRGNHQPGAHTSWTYTAIEPGTYLWRSPYGYTYLREPDGGTRDLTPRPVDPPGS